MKKDIHNEESENFEPINESEFDSTLNDQDDIESLPSQNE